MVVRVMGEAIDHRKTSRCAYCGRRVVWCSVEGRRKSMMVCLERDASPDGTVRVRPDHGYLWAKPLAGPELEKARDLWAEPLWKRHECREQGKR